jgi:hypothetical protein
MISSSSAAVTDCDGTSTEVHAIADIQATLTDLEMVLISQPPLKITKILKLINIIHPRRYAPASDFPAALSGHCQTNPISKTPLILGKTNLHAA